MQAIADYFAAWNEPADEQRRELLGGCVTPDVEVVHPTWGLSRGVDALMEHIDRYRSAMPGTTIDLASNVDGHNSVFRYAWTIVDDTGDVLMEGLDVVELADDNRLKRIVLFHGRLADA